MLEETTRIRWIYYRRFFRK